MFAGTDLEYHIRDRQVIIRKAISREETRPIVMQQDKVTVKGIVTDAKGEAIIGANIIEKGTTNGTITDIDGRFTLVVSEKASLVFSYIGYLTQEMLVGKKTFLNVQLQEDNKTLDEVVITGYGGTQLRSKMTNSIAKVDNSTLSTGPILIRRKHSLVQWQDYGYSKLAVIRIPLLLWCFVVVPIWMVAVHLWLLSMVLYASR